MSVVIRAERPGDEPAIRAVTREAFATAEHSSGTEQLIVDALRARRRLTGSCVAERDGTVVGHVAISPVTISPGPDDAEQHVIGWYGLGPVSVLPEHQGQGIGTALVRAALDAIAGEQGCVVLGDPGYYGRFGFRAEASVVLPGVPPEVFQVLRLAATEIPRGTVAYDEAFEAGTPDGHPEADAGADRPEAPVSSRP